MKSLFLLMMLLHFLPAAEGDPINEAPGKEVKSFRVSQDDLILSISDVTVNESVGTAVLTVSLSGSSPEPIKIRYETKNGSAISPDDYEKVKGKLTIPAGSLSATISIPIVSDGENETDEYFDVIIHVSNKYKELTLEDNSARVTIAVGHTTYIELNNLVVVYKHTNDGDVPENFRSLLLPALLETNTFYWRNSHMTLNIKWTVYEVEERLDIVRLDGVVFPSDVDADLRNRGFTEGEFDAVLAVVAGGTARAYGVNVILGHGGYCQVPAWNDHWQLSWDLTRMFHQVVDAMFANSDRTDYPHNQPGIARINGEYVPHSGWNWDLNAEILRFWKREDWFALNETGTWGTTKTVLDQDLDTVPDNDVDVPINESTFGSNVALKDEDEDGLSDLQEIMTGIFTSTRPDIVDSDGDGLTDGNDSEPIYPLNTIVPFNPNLSLAQDVTLWPLSGNYFFNKPESNSSSLYLGYSETHLYLGIKLAIPQARLVAIYIDANNDGMFYGRDNIFVSLEGNTIGIPLLFDPTSVEPGDPLDFRTFPLPREGFSGASKTGPGWSSYQLIIPRLDENGLILTPGKLMGIKIEVFQEGSIVYGPMFEPDDMLTVALGEEMNNTKVRLVKEKDSISYELHVAAFPNPSNNYFTLQWKGKNQPVSINITDGVGRLVEKRSGLPGVGTIKVGNSLRPGIYYVQFTQATEKRIFKLVKN
jgi:Calx-beta domain/Secretion system C-terminal sorting domain